MIVDVENINAATQTYWQKAEKYAPSLTQEIFLSRIRSTIYPNVDVAYLYAEALYRTWRIDYSDKGSAVAFLGEWESEEVWKRLLGVMRQMAELPFTYSARYILPLMGLR